MKTRLHRWGVRACFGVTLAGGVAVAGGASADDGSPKAGKCIVTPSTGAAGSSFEIRAEGFEDPEGPLEYRFGVRSPSLEGRWLTQQGASNVASVVLPDLNGEGTVTCSVSDAQGRVTQVKTQVTVRADTPEKQVEPPEETPTEPGKPKAPPAEEDPNNQAPSGGKCVITPSYGKAKSTEFKIKAVGYSDPDKPLTYRFGYRSDRGVRWITKWRSKNVVSRTLPTLGKNGTIYCEVADSKGKKRRTKQAVWVAAPPSDGE